jgi:hypothetical protein
MQTSRNQQKERKEGVLGDNLGSVRLTERFCAGNRERHAPEIRIGSDKFDANESLTVALAADGNNMTFDRAVAAFIDELEGLARDDNLIEQEQPAIAVDGLRGSLCGELLSIVGLPMNCDWHGEADPQCAASFFAAEVENSHGNYLPQIRVKKLGRYLREKQLQQRSSCALGRPKRTQKRNLQHQEKSTGIVRYLVTADNSWEVPKLSTAIRYSSTSHS